MVTLDSRRHARDEKTNDLEGNDTVMDKLPHTERLSRRSRRHRLQLNRISDQHLHEQVTDLTDQFVQKCARLRTHRKLEEQRQQLLSVTVKQIADERQRATRVKSSVKPPPVGESCTLFSNQCQLYPCQPVYRYTSFMKREHDRTVRERNVSTPTSSSTSSQLQQLFSSIQEKKHQPNRRQLAVTIQNQHYLLKRHVSMQRTMATLDEQSLRLHTQLTDKATFGYARERRHDLSRAIKRHLETSAKFCA